MSRRELETHEMRFMLKYTTINKSRNCLPLVEAIKVDVVDLARTSGALSSYRCETPHRKARKFINEKQTAGDNSPHIRATLTRLGSRSKQRVTLGINLEVRMRQLDANYH